MRWRALHRQWGLVGICLVAGLGCAVEEDPRAEAEAAFRDGDYATASTRFAEAIEVAAPSSRPALRARLGQTLKLLGQAEAAEEMMRRAILEAEAHDDGALAARTRRYLGRLLADKGRVPQAAEAYAAAAAWYQAHGPAGELVKTQINRAGLAWGQGDFGESWALYQDAYQRAVALEDERLQANGLDGLAMLLAYVGEFEDARGLLLQTATMHQAAGRVADAAVAYATLGIVAAAEGEAGEAARLGEIALGYARKSGHKAAESQALLVLAMAAAERRAFAEVLRHAEAARDIAGAAGIEPLRLEAELIAIGALAGAGRWSAFAARADAFNATGPEHASRLATLRARHAAARDDAGARRRHLEEAVRHFDRLRSALGVEQLSAVLTAERLEAYEALIEVLADAGEAEAALRVVGGIKARAFVERIRAAREAEEAPAPPAKGSESALPSRRTVQRATNLFQLGAIRPPSDPAAVRRALPADVAVIEYYALADRVLVFWLDHERAEVHSVPVSRRLLTATAERHLLGIRANGRDHEVPGKRLGRWLLDPLAARLAAAKGLRLMVIVPHGPLHMVPFEALPWAGRLLLDRAPVVSAANLTAVAVALDAPEARDTGRVVAVGDPMANLPGARRETQEVAEVFARVNTQALLGPAALESAVVDAIGEADLLHFAVHGVRPRPEAPAYLELVPDSAADGKLHADELATRRLVARLVVLSVCDSGAGRPNRGDEIVGVVDRAFLEAGAASVVASRWPVHDAASVLFMRNFYAALQQGDDLLDAFHRAQLALRHGRARPEQLGPLLASLDGSRVRGVEVVEGRRRRIRDFTHPYFWATFSLRGAWR